MGETPGATTTSDDDESFDALLQAAARASVAAPAALLRPGSRLCGDRFEVQRRLGQGGMGAVYEVRDAERGEVVALKTLNRLDAAGIYRLKNEFRALVDVGHENLVRLHELVAEGEHWLFTMDRIGGVTFDAWVRPDGRLDLPRLRARARSPMSATPMLSGREPSARRR